MPRIRSALSSLLLLAACADDPRGLTVTINTVSLQIDRSAPDELADLELSVELVARDRATTTRPVEVEAVTLPDGDFEIAFVPELLGSMGPGVLEDVSLGSGETRGVRVLNASVTNAQLLEQCMRPMDLTVVFEDGDARPQDTATVTPGCRN